jgi:septum formation protein
VEISHPGGSGDPSDASVTSGAAALLALGSASPRRRDLLTMIGVPFVVCPADADETARVDEPSPEYVVRVTRAKLEAVRRRDLGSAGRVLVADTVVVAPDGALLGKPRDDEDAARMLGQLAGATHAVSTCFMLALRDPGSEPVYAQTVTTRVTFRPLSAGELLAYVAGGEGRDKAGAYAVQGRGAAFVERIDGSFTGVVGLPVCELLVALRALRWVAAP